MKDRICFYVCVFGACSIIGWFIELVFRSIKAGWLVVPGFMFGCYLPIYGFGAILMILLFDEISRRKFGFYDMNFMPLIVFAGSVIILSVSEYVTHYALEKLLNLELWSYSAHRFNLNGRISLKQSILIGVAGTYFIYIIYPRMKRFFRKLSSNSLKMMTLGITIVFCVDFIFSLMNHLQEM